MSRRKSGGVRTVVHLSHENYIAVAAVLTPEGSMKPPFGAISLFFNGLVDQWRARQSQQQPEVPNVGYPSNPNPR